MKQIIHKVLTLFKKDKHKEIQPPESNPKTDFQQQKLSVPPFLLNN